MSKKHFEALAQKLKNLKPSGENQFASPKAKHMALGKMEQWEEMVKGVADFCASQNDRFNREQFLAACGV